MSSELEKREKKMSKFATEKRSKNNFNLHFKFAIKKKTRYLLTNLD